MLCFSRTFVFSTLIATLLGFTTFSVSYAAKQPSPLLGPEAAFSKAMSDKLEPQKKPDEKQGP